VNSEELEQSLRTEFEGYLKNILADMNQEVSQFQQKIDTEIEKHKSHLDEVFQEFSARIQKDKEFDQGFKESVVEHLRLARDEGARITATAIAEAEELTKSEKKDKDVVVAAPSVKLSEIRDAIHDISSQNSQSAILKSLINHAAQFTPRGAFFVVKNQHFVGWRVFGKQENLQDDAITEIIFPVSPTTILGESVSSLSVVESTFGTYSDDADYLSKLDFGEPEKMFAIPLIARGRGVAAIYVDNGDDTDEVNVEALETLVSVAGLTVELLAAAQSSNYTREPVTTGSYAATKNSQDVEESDVSAVSDYEERVEATYEDSESQYEEQSDELVADQKETVQDLTSFYSKEAETSDEDETESEEIYNTLEPEIQEVEVAEPVSYRESADTVETSSYQDFVEEDEESVYEISDEFGSTETENLTAPQIVNVEDYNFSGEEKSENELVEPDYAGYDDDLIEEVQAQTESPEDEEIESVYEEPFVAETPSAEVFEETSETSAIKKPVWNAPEESIEEVSGSYSFETDLQNDSEIETLEPTDINDVTEDFSKTSTFNYADFETNQDFNSSPVQFEEPVEKVETADFEYSQPVVEETPQEKEVEKPEEISLSDFQTVEVAEKEEPATVAEPVAVAEPVVTAPVRTRFSERNVDLPIEVSEEERRLHNDARRFARLLISEIKLYNEQKVKEGREANDLYDRLREAIDRSREMYDKRVQPVVVERFDYFHFEVVNTLAEGEESKLGTTYPGVTAQV
jgi:hypothetical protein